MADGTAIEWTDATVNAINGCTVVSPGCTNCYAMRLAGTRMKDHPTRAGLTIETKAGPVWNGEVRLNEKALLEPLRWAKPRMIFWNAHGDMFHPNVPDELIDRCFAVMALTPQHIHQVLTKRSARMRRYMTALERRFVHESDFDAWLVSQMPGRSFSVLDRRGLYLDFQGPLNNVWLGVSAEDQTRADERIPDLLATPAAVRWVSAEPLLGRIDFTRIPSSVDEPEDEGYYHSALERSDIHYRDGDPDILTGRVVTDAVDGPMMERIDWIVVGGESGPHARPMHPQWARDIRDQCEAAGVPFFFKQWGSWKPICNMPEAEHDAFYRSNRVAGDDEDQSVLDELYGRSCTIPTMAIGYGGATGFDAFRVVDGRGGMQMFHVGKKAAGRLLDGREHNAMPAIAERIAA